MWEVEAAARASNSSGTVEVVLDNTDDTKNLAIPKVVLKEKAPCPTNSSNDQRVPTNQNYKNIPAHRKRSKFIEEERPQPYKLHSDDNVVRTSRKDEELCSAQSSASKKQATSRCSFSVPRCCSSSECKPSQECESSDLKQSWEAQIEKEQSSCKDGKQLSNCTFSIFFK
jgi:cryptochrome 2